MSLLLSPQGAQMTSMTAISPPSKIVSPSSTANPTSETRTLKRLIWLYFWLLLLEGVLRKWILPQFSAPLLIVRDPVVIAIYALAMLKGKFPINPFVITVAALGLLSVLASMAGEGTLSITLFGLRTNFLHLPLIFVMPTVFNRQDVRKIGQRMVVVAPCIALFVIAQFLSEPSSWLNVGAGAGERGQLESSFGKIRPAGPFAFVSGMIAYSSLLAALLYEHFMRSAIYAKYLATAATVSLAVCLGFSGSRSSIAGVAVVTIAATLAAMRNGALGKLLKGPVLLGALAYFSLSLWSEFQLGLSVNQERFSASGIQGGLILRFLSGLKDPLIAASSAPLLGHGLGLGTNAGATMKTGEVSFLMGEGEWGRVIMESGPTLGLSFIALRLAIVVFLATASMRQLRLGNSLPLLILSACLVDLMQGQFGPPTILGFAVFGGGLCLSACQPEISEAARNSSEAGDGSSRASSILFRGRSVYAEQLHR